MDQNQSPSIFGLGVDPESKAHLAEVARWARFLAIVGFVMCGLIVLAGFFAGSLMSSMTSRYPTGFGRAYRMNSSMSTMISVLYILFAILYFFPCLYLFRFANFMKAAIASEDQENLNKSFLNLKAMFKFVGILTIIIISLYVLAIIFAVIGASMAGF